MNEDIGRGNADTGTQRDLARMDVEFIRVLEDLIDVLLAKGVINLTDLPPEALGKLNRRRHARQRMRGALDLLPGDDDLI